MYEVIPVVVFGATPGKAMFGLRVRRRPDDPVPDWLAATTRAVVLYGPPLVFAGPGLVVLLVLLVSLVVPGSGRGLHDRLAGTRVVSVAER